MPRRAILSLGAGGLATVLVGAAPWARRVAAVSGGTVRLAGDEPSTLDPAHVRDTVSSSYVVEIFAGLTRIGPALTPEPELAADWTIDRDGVLYRFRLREGLRFHDGSALSADDVKWSWERALSPSTGSLSARVLLDDIEGAAEVMTGQTDELRGVRVMDPRTLEVRLSAPAAFFPAKLTHGPALVVDRRNVELGGEWFRRPNGSGPYRLVEWQPETRIVLERAETYVPRRTGPERVECLQLDPGEDLLRYEQDELDLVAIGGADVERFSDPREVRTEQLVETPTLCVDYLGFNTAVPPFDDVAVRRAFAMAIDRPRMNRVTLRGTQVEARGIVPPGLPGHRRSYGGLPFSPASARWELGTSRYGSPEALPEIVLTVPGSGLLEGPITRAIVRPWHTHLGVSVLVQQLEFTDFIHALDQPEHDLQMFLLGWCADFPDPFDFLDVLFGSARPDNYSQLSDPVVDDLLEQAREASDEATRLRLYARVESRVVERAVIVPPFFSVDHELVQPWISGYRGRPMVREWLTEIETSRA